MKGVIITRIIGGIGNQLFSYAAARRLALVNNVELAIDHVSYFPRDKYQRSYQLDNFNIPCRKATARERLEPFSRYRRYLKRKFNKLFPFEKRNYIKQEFIDFDQRLLEYKPATRVYLEGYWQSEMYFKDIEKTIRSELRIKPPTDSYNLELAQKIKNKNAVAVHVRFFDLPGKSGVNNVSSNYYERAVVRMETLVPNAYYYIFSDQPVAARSIIPLPDNRLTCVSHNIGDINAYKDLWLMTQCKHFITSNSTFSWWGAWLSIDSYKSIVITPGFIKGSCTAWGFKGLIPTRWTIIGDSK